MSTLKDIQHTIAPELQQLHDRIATALSSSNSLMTQVVTTYLSSKGKLIRPILVILTAKLLGKMNDNVILAAAAVEMLHNASLIHDDVVDESDKRRNRPTINSLWDNHIAVLVGDFFVSSALQQALATGDIRIVGSLARLGRLLSLGEVDQLYSAQNHILDEKAYFEIISRKTASLFVSCVEMGSYAVGVDDYRLESMRHFAELLGLCFQIKDDIFDYYSDDKIGKPTGNDLREGKVTLPLLYALNQRHHPRSAEMRALIEKEVLTSEDISSLIEYAKEAGGIDYAYQTMERLSQEASHDLDAFDNQQERETFRRLFDYIITREA
ncbi:MAG: polyprenyl synthetase family protein [Bacteroidales bacterium]|nr:polyprenyl synthetase family protein [Bacteroidales bacterium]